MNKKSTLLLGIFLLFFSITRAQQWGDYTLYATQNGTTANLLDTNGNIYHTWTFPSTKKTGYSTYMLPGGSLMRTVARAGNSFSGGPICGEVQKVDWNGNVVWDFVYSTTTYCTHHDICPMPNGNVLLIAYESKTAAEVTQAGSSKNIVMWPDKIVEIKPTGATTGDVVWEWHAWDHLVQNYDNTKSNYYSSIVNHPELLNINYKTAQDWIHMNGISYNEELSQVCFSSHFLNEIYVIDHSTTTAEAATHSGGKSGKGGDLLYRWGNPPAYGANATATINAVHDAHWIPKGCPNAGYLVGFSNEGISATQSAVFQVSPPYNGYTYAITQGQAYTPTSYTKVHACKGHTKNMGGSQQLPNGNMLVCIAQAGYIYEIDSSGNLLWSTTTSGAVAKAFRYSKCYITGGDTPIISQNINSLMSSSAASYQWYFNGSPIAGATSQTYSPTQKGMYQVQIVNASGCSAISNQLSFYFNSINTLSDNNNLNIYPNPTDGIVNIEGSIAKEQFEIYIRDITGRLISKTKNTNILDLSTFNKGIYE